MQAITLDCPSCERPTDTGELQSHKGVCKYCKTAFSNAHRGFLLTKRERSHHQVLRGDEHATAFDPTTGSLTETVEFDYAAIDEALGHVEQATPDARHEAAELLAKLFFFVWGGPRTDGKLTKQNLRCALARFSIVGGAIRRDLVPETFDEIAAVVGTTKQNLSVHSRRFCEAFNFETSRGRTAESRAAMRRAALKAHGRRAGTTPGKESFTLKVGERSDRTRQP